MFKEWFKDKKVQQETKKNMKVYSNISKRHDPGYVDGRYGWLFQVFIQPILILYVLVVIPSDNSVIFGEKTLTMQPQVERRLDWLDVLEKSNKQRQKSSESLVYDICCCPFQITFKSFKSKK